MENNLFDDQFFNTTYDTFDKFLIQPDNDSMNEYDLPQARNSSPNSVAFDDFLLPQTDSDHYLEPIHPREQDSDNESVLEDGLYHTTVSDDTTESEAFGNNEEVDVGENLYTWKINHAKGEHKLKGINLTLLFFLIRRLF
jgi:hypothetical protein